MQKTQKIIAAALSLLLLFSAIPSASAQQNPTGSGLSISPTVSDFTIKPGNSANLTITLKNITVDDVIAKGAVNDFTSDNSTGNPKIITNSETTSPNSIKKFVNNLDDVPLSKGQQKKVTLGIYIPPGTSPGAYYGIIRYRAVPKALNNPGPGQVALTASVGTIVLITVPGNIREQVQVKGLSIYRGSRAGTLFIKPPTSIGITITNFGNGFIRPFGKVEVHNVFNKTVASFDFNNPKQPGNVLPNSTRNFMNNVKGIDKIGKYTVIASVSYGNGSQVLTLKKDFWYIPIWLIIIILLILAALIWLAMRSYRNYRRGGRHSR